MKIDSSDNEINNLTQGMTEFPASELLELLNKVKYN